jgi:hypothetical protein
MKRFIVLVLTGCILSCHGPRAKTAEEKALDAKMEETRQGNPGLKQECLDKERSGQIGAMAWVNNPDCFEMMPDQRWSGLLEIGWEWSDFCPDPAKKCDWMSERGIWMTFAKGAYQGPELPDGTYRIEFVGRRTKVPGNFGHQGGYEHLMVADRVISIQKIPGEKYTKRF